VREEKAKELKIKLQKMQSKISVLKSDEFYYDINKENIQNINVAMS
jgi:hypothetical protein